MSVLRRNFIILQPKFAPVLTSVRRIMSNKEDLPNVSNITLQKVCMKIVLFIKVEAIKDYFWNARTLISGHTSI